MVRVLIKPASLRLTISATEIFHFLKPDLNIPGINAPDGNGERFGFL
jgi:hypothetical protein